MPGIYTDLFAAGCPGRAVFCRFRSGSLLTQIFRSTGSPSQIASRTANRCSRVTSEGVYGCPPGLNRISASGSFRPSHRATHSNRSISSDDSFRPSDFVARVRFRCVSADIGCRSKDLLHVESVRDSDRSRQPLHIVDVHTSHRCSHLFLPGWRSPVSLQRSDHDPMVWPLPRATVPGAMLAGELYDPWAIPTVGIWSEDGGYSFFFPF